MNCYLCGSKESTVRPGKCRDNPKIKIIECNQCSLVYLSDFSHVGENFYEDSGQVKSNNENKILSTAPALDTIRRFKQFSSLFVNKSILDFGCGKGHFLMKLKNENITSKLSSLEINEDYYHHLNENFNHFSSIDEIEDQSIDYITIFHVLEHLTNPLDVINKLYSKLKKGGKIIIEVPSSDDILLKTYKSESFSRYTYWSLHLYLFNTSTLKKLLNKSLFDIIYVKQYQRYSLANHLYWLSRGKPGGHLEYHFLENDILNELYSKKLAEIGQCDTIIALIEKK